jgi:hypothetical protein
MGAIPLCAMDIGISKKVRRFPGTLPGKEEMPDDCS